MMDAEQVTELVNEIAERTATYAFFSGVAYGAQYGNTPLSKGGSHDHNMEEISNRIRRAIESAQTDLILSGRTEEEL